MITGNGGRSVLYAAQLPLVDVLKANYWLSIA